jgi:hypothetical protein
MSWPEAPQLPFLEIPEHYPLPGPTIEVPQVELPKHPPLVVPPSDLRPPPGIQGEEKDEAPKEEKTTPSVPKETQLIEVPFTDVEVPMPTTEIMTAAATTAVISVAATLTATSLFKWLVTVMKPVFKQTWNKLTKKKPPKAS